MRCVGLICLLAGLLFADDVSGIRPRESDISVYPTATIGYESGTDSYGRRRGGVYTAAGVGVGVGDDPRTVAPPRPASTDRDRTTMEKELADKALPEGKTTRAVAGYLYFPKPTARQRNAGYEITWYGNDRQVHLTIPDAK